MNAQVIYVFVVQALIMLSAQVQVVADSACEKYAVDIAAFATCDSPTRVARPEAIEVNEAAAKDTERLAQTPTSLRGDPARVDDRGKPASAPFVARMH